MSVRLYAQFATCMMTHRDCTQKNYICIDTTSRYPERQFPVSHAVLLLRIWYENGSMTAYTYCHSHKAIGTALGAFLLLLFRTLAVAR